MSPVRAVPPRADDPRDARRASARRRSRGVRVDRRRDRATCSAPTCRSCASTTPSHPRPTTTLPRRRCRVRGLAAAAWIGLVHAGGPHGSGGVLARTSGTDRRYGLRHTRRYAGSGLAPAVLRLRLHERSTPDHRLLRVGNHRHDHHRGGGARHRTSRSRPRAADHHDSTDDHARRACSPRLAAPGRGRPLPVRLHRTAPQGQLRHQDDHGRVRPDAASDLLRGRRRRSPACSSGSTPA